MSQTGIESSSCGEGVSQAGPVDDRYDGRLAGVSQSRRSVYGRYTPSQQRVSAPRRSRVATDSRRLGTGQGVYQADSRPLRSRQTPRSSRSWVDMLSVFTRGIFVALCFIARGAITALRILVQIAAAVVLTIVDRVSVAAGRGPVVYGRRGRYAPGRGYAPLAAGMAAIAIVLAAIWGVHTAFSTPESVERKSHTYQIAANENFALERPATPTAQWTQGSLPWLYQTDSQWSATSYAGATVKESGCGPTCLTMVYIWATGKTDMTPADMARFSEQNGYVQSGMTAWALMSEGASKLGISSEVVPLDSTTMLSVLEKGQPVIVSVKPGTFTTVGHFMVLEGVTKDGKVILHDPNSAANSMRYWDVQQILDEANTAWTYTRA